MISVLHNNNAVFLHCYKTGGIYVESILHYYDTLDRTNILSLQNIKSKEDYEFKSKEEEEKYNNFDGFLNLKEVEKYGIFGYHVKDPILNKLYKMTETKWNNYFKFTFLRNPYDRAISSFEFLKKKYKNNLKLIKNENKDENENIIKQYHEIINNFNETNFHDFFCHREKFKISYIENHAYLTQYQMCKNTFNDVKIDYYAKYENLNEELIFILHKIGITDIDKHLLFIKKNRFINESLNKKEITSYYNEESLKAINELFADDFEHFGFQKYETVEEVNKFLKTYNTKEDQINKNNELFNKYGDSSVKEDKLENKVIHKMIYQKLKPKKFYKF